MKSVKDQSAKMSITKIQYIIHTSPRSTLIHMLVLLLELIIKIHFSSDLLKKISSHKNILQKSAGESWHGGVSERSGLSEPGWSVVCRICVEGGVETGEVGTVGTRAAFATSITRISESKSINKWKNARNLTLAFKAIEYGCKITKL